MEYPDIYLKPDQAAKFLSLSERTVLDMARRGEMPAHVVSGKKRRTWRFKLKELIIYMDTPFQRGTRVVGEGGRLGICLTSPFSDKVANLWICLQWDDGAIPVAHQMTGLNRE